MGFSNNVKNKTIPQTLPLSSSTNTHSTIHSTTVTTSLTRPQQSGRPAWKTLATTATRPVEVSKTAKLLHDHFLSDHRKIRIANSSDTIAFVKLRQWFALLKNKIADRKRYSLEATLGV
jgi:hypothetical protein